MRLQKGAKGIADRISAMLLGFLFSLHFPLAVLLLSPVMYVVLNSLVPALLGSQDLKKK
jgi:inner membrane protein involved in colicin E2 resistance|tara:strand:+ start:105 stop:281 length:177 start_codon:yes stop_codon:yes gene_type:complete